ncbi:carboxylate-amine ligase [Nocardia goodfellowii]|uniref:Putative glutamate--cysteine ligase 2 n=1 Tax=Nocardia goodfellowii TaxID=882446 RepID=A0ABS4QN32_9NOCA|nr:glutamate--cysteine ligase [Nocardia goodfellowii]MBP2193117.1 carboxylate-amine ligase [Nocardia goodfellowii]
MDLTIGVEEEFVLTDADSRQVVRRAATVLRRVGNGARQGGGAVELEMAQTQVESASRVCSDLAALRSELVRLRREMADAAEASGCRLIASGTAVLGVGGPPPILDKPRYHRIADRFGPLVDQQCTCACHVHVGVADREEAVQVVNHLRPWLPALLAISANSPFWEGRDTGYHSWRTPLWARWPASGPPPFLGSYQEYEDVVAELQHTGAILDGAMVYWYARPSRHLPTVEVRVADVTPTVDEAVVLAALVRALVSTALTEIRSGAASPPVNDQVLRAACWHAARYGLGAITAIAGAGGMPGRVGGAAELITHIRPALEAADGADMVLEILRSVRRDGTGADRQRAAFRRRGRLEDVVDLLAEQTAGR